MELSELSRPDLFLADASPLLLRDEARHNLIFGICATLVETPDAYAAFHLWTVEDAGDLVAAAVMTPPFNIVVAEPHSSGALRFLAEELHRREMDLPGVTGALPEGEEFVGLGAADAGAATVAHAARDLQGELGTTSRKCPRQDAARHPG
jgi:uncharacterized protein